MRILSALYLNGLVVAVIRESRNIKLMPFWGSLGCGNPISVSLDVDRVQRFSKVSWMAGQLTIVLVGEEGVGTGGVGIDVVFTLNTSITDAQPGPTQRWSR